MMMMMEEKEKKANSKSKMQILNDLTTSIKTFVQVYALTNCFSSHCDFIPSREFKVVLAHRKEERKKTRIS